MRRAIVADIEVASVSATGDANQFGAVPCKMIFTFDAAKELVDDGTIDNLKLVTQIEIPIASNDTLRRKLEDEN